MLQDKDYKEGDCVIIPTGQAGTIIQNISGQLMVILRNGDVWNGTFNEVYYPTSQEELDLAPIHVDKIPKKYKRKK